MHYKGSLIDGREFDNSYERSCPDALRLSDVIEGWQVALQKMHVGDKWIIYIPYTMGVTMLRAPGETVPSPVSSIL